MTESERTRHAFHFFSQNHLFRAFSDEYFQEKSLFHIAESPHRHHRVSRGRPKAVRECRSKRPDKRALGGQRIFATCRNTTSSNSSLRRTRTGPCLVTLHAHRLSRRPSRARPAQTRGPTMRRDRDLSCMYKFPAPVIFAFHVRCMRGHDFCQQTGSSCERWRNMATLQIRNRSPPRTPRDIRLRRDG